MEDAQYVGRISMCNNGFYSLRRIEILYEKLSTEFIDIQNRLLPIIILNLRKMKLHLSKFQCDLDYFNFFNMTVIFS